MPGALHEVLEALVEFRGLQSLTWKKQLDEIAVIFLTGCILAVECYKIGN